MPEIRFPTTHWTLLMQAKGSENRAREALNQLCSNYWFPLFSFARFTLGASPQEAEDLTQGFFEHLLKRRLFGRAEPDCGKFRNYLLVSFRNFYTSDLQRNKALKRGGGEKFVPIDQDLAERRLAAEAPDLPAERRYDRTWALEVLNHAYRRTEIHYSAQGKLENFRFLQPFLQSPSALPYASAAELLGKSEDAVRMEVSRLRRTFAEAFRSVVADTVENQSEVEEEVRYLVQLLTQ